MTRAVPHCLGQSRGFVRRPTDWQGETPVTRATPNFPPCSPDELDALSDDFPRTSTSSISTVDNMSNVVKATFQPQLLSDDVRRKYRDAPWARTFHLNERNLVWSDDFKERLFKKFNLECNFLVVYGT